MKPFVVLLTLLVTFPSWAALHNPQIKPSVKDLLEAPQDSRECFKVRVDRRSYDAAIARGATSDEALAQAQVVLDFDRKAYDQLIALGLSSNDAESLASTYDYLDKSRHCQILRFEFFTNRLLKLLERD